MPIPPLEELGMSTRAQNAVSSAEVVKTLMDVKNSLIDRLSTIESLTQSDHVRPQRPSFYIAVDNRSVKKDRLVYGTSTEKKRSSGKKKKQKIDASADNLGTVGFIGAPFSVQTKRFQHSGVHPKLLIDAVGIAGDAKTSPYSYAPDILHSNAADQIGDDLFSWKDPNYHKSMVLTRDQKIMKEKEQKIKNKIGPGRYDVAGPLKALDAKPVSEKAAIIGRQARFLGEKPMDNIRRGHIHRDKWKKMLVIPGPGTYSVKDPMLEGRHVEFRDQPGLFNSSVGHRDQSIHGSDLPPGLYPVPESIKNLLKKQTGNRGMYDVFSESRYSRICTGTGQFKPGQNISTLINRNLGPGAYNPKTKFRKDKIDFRHVTEHEKLMIRNRTSKPFYPPLHRDNKNPGPGAYEKKSFIIAAKEDPTGKVRKADKVKGISAIAQAKAQMWTDNYGFLSSTKKKDKFTTEMWGYSRNTVGPGRYNLAAVDNYMKQRNGNKSAFDSQTKRQLSNVIDQQDVVKQRLQRERQRKQQKLEKVMKDMHSWKHKAALKSSKNWVSHGHMQSSHHHQ